MAKINELREKRAKIWEQAKAFLDSHRNETGILSAEDTAAYEKMEKDIVDLGHEIERQQRADDLERELNLPTSTPLVSKPDNVNRESKTGTASEKYNKAFWNQMRNRSTQEVRNILSEGVDSEGGFLVPETFENTLVQALDEELVIRQLAHTFTTASRGGKVSEEDISYILGHKKNQTQKYGSIPAKEFSNRINKVKYKLDFKLLEKKLKSFYKN